MILLVLKFLFVLSVLVSIKYMLTSSLKFSLSFHKLLFLTTQNAEIFDQIRTSVNYPHKSFVHQKTSVSGWTLIYFGVCSHPRHRTLVHVIDCLFTCRWMIKVMFTYNFNWASLGEGFFFSSVPVSCSY